MTVEWAYSEPEARSDGWLTDSLADVGMESGPLESLVNSVRDQDDHLIHGVVIVREGKLVFEKYFDGRGHPTWGERPISFKWDTTHGLSSVTKSLTTTLLGIALHRGIIASIDQPVFESFPELESIRTSEKSAITLEHLVTLTSGLDWDEWTYPFSDSRNDLIRFIQLAQYNTRGSMQFLLGKPVIATPGTTLRYNGGAFNVLGKIVQKASGQRLDVFARETLFSPLGIHDASWWVFSDDLVYASGDVRMRPRDLAKVGQLYLQGGIWEGERILSQEWAQSAGSPYSTFRVDPQTGNIGYDHGWWVKNDSYGAGAFSADGWGGQRLFVMPEFEMVVVITSGGYSAAPFISGHRIVQGHILPANTYSGVKQ
ncbi:serine hydrolase domain-containing protein [Gemmatimonadota bacterium]